MEGRRSIFYFRRISTIAELDRWDRSLNLSIDFRQFREQDNSVESKKKFRVLHEVEVEDVVGFGARRARNGYLKIVT